MRVTCFGFFSITKVIMSLNQKKRLELFQPLVDPDFRQSYGNLYPICKITDKESKDNWQPLFYGYFTYLKYGLFSKYPMIYSI